MKLKTRPGRFAITSSVLLAFGQANLSMATTPLQGEQAISADSFVDSIGVNTHFSYSDTYYYSQWPLISQLLISSGVRHIRDGGPNAPQWYYDRINSLYTSAGIRNIGSPGQGNLPTLVQSMITSMPYLEGFESLNEYNTSGDANWVTTLRTYQPALYSAVKSNPATAKLPVIGPALVINWITDPQNLGSLSSSLDFGNLHNYLSGRNPGTAGWGGYYDGYALGSIGFNLAVESLIAGTKPVWTTETGYNWGTTKGGDSPDDINARYLPRLFLEQFRQGIKRTYQYQFAAQGPSAASGDGSGQFGLIDFNLNLKPSYHALQNLITVLNDKGASFQPFRLNYNIIGGTAGLHHVLMQKQNGTFYLAVWLEAEGFNTNTWTYETVAPQTVTLSLPLNAKSISTVHFNDAGTVSSSPITLTQDQASLTVSDKVQIIEITPHDRLVANGDTGMCVGTANGVAPAVGAAVGLYPCSANDSVTQQMWQLEPENYNSITYYAIKENGTKETHCLSVKQASLANAAPIVVTTCNGVSSPEQLWQFVKSSAGNYYELVSAKSQKCLHVTNGKFTSGSQLEQFDCNSSSGAYKFWQYK